MDIKDLNKPQLILLAVLLSFVTSIATGITTVTLMQQAPTSVTTPINRVVQQTVEKIQQIEGKTTVQTVVVKEEDLIVDAIAKNRKTVFSITKDGIDMNGDYAEISAGRGFAVSAAGIIVVDASQVSGKNRYYIKNDSGKFKAEYISSNGSGFAFLRAGEPLNGEDKLLFDLPQEGDLNKMKIGQKIILLGSGINSFIFEGLNASNSIDLVVSSISAGSLVVNLDGEALGMALAGGGTSFVPIGVINEAAKNLSVSSKN